MRKLTLLVIALLPLAVAYAQKLPNIQQAGLRSPQNFRVDGKATEWNKQYQAYNSGAEIYYSLSNTDTTLNLVVHAVNPQVIQKILENGIIFTVFKSKSNKTGADAKILFPSLSLAESWKIMKGMDLPLSGFKKIEGLPPGFDKTDSVLATQKEFTLAGVNKQLASTPKEIRFMGIDAIKDTLTGITPKSPYYRNFSLRDGGYKYISIYNENGIMAAVQFDDNKELTYELSVPVKYVRANIINNALSYDITINARDGGRPGVVVYFERDRGGAAFPELFNATNLKGVYTLVK